MPTLRPWLSFGCLLACFAFPGTPVFGAFPSRAGQIEVSGPELAKSAVIATGAAIAADSRFPMGYREAQVKHEQSLEALRKQPRAAQDQAVLYLIGLLKSKDLRERARAASVLAQLREVARPAERPLLQAMKTENFEVRTIAAQALLSISPTAPPAGHSSAFAEILAPDLSRELASPKVRARLRGLVTVSLLGPIASIPMTPVLLQLLRDPEPHVRAGAAQTVGGLKDLYAQAAPFLLPLLNDPEIWVRAAAMQALGRMGELARPALPQMIEALRAQDAELREAARVALSQLPSEAGQQAVPVLIQGLSLPDAALRSQSAESLARLGAQAKTALPALVHATEDPDPDTQRNALWAISALGSAAEPALPPLRERLKNGDKNARKSAAQALGRLPQFAIASVPALMEAARDPDPEVQGAVAQALADFGPQVKNAVPRLISWLSDANPEMRKLAAFVLGRAGPEASGALPQLVQMARTDADLEVRLAAIHALGSVRNPSVADGASPKISTATLVQILRTPDSRIKQAALSALQMMPVSEAQMDAQAALSDPSALVREAAVGFLGTLGSFGFLSSDSALVGLLKDKDPAVARRVVATMGVLGPKLSASALTEIENGMKDRHAPEAARLYAIKALCRLEKYGAPAINDLVALFERKSEPSILRDHAAFALSIIGGYPRRMERRIQEILSKKKEYFQGLDF